jgi:S1-C subfamily serine protease
MIGRRTAFATSLIAIAISAFTLGVTSGRRSDAARQASYDAQLDAIRTEMKTELVKARGGDVLLPTATATAGHATRGAETPTARQQIVTEVKAELQSEMGLLPVQLLRDRRSSFVELYSYDSAGKTNYGTAGYLGNGYFITVKHAVVALSDDDDRPIPVSRKITSIKIVYDGKEIPAKVVDTGDANTEVHSGDWAVIRTRVLDLPALHPNTAFAYDFADPIFRLGNDYSKGIILSTGYVGQRTANGLVTCLTDGHPGVSGGGVLDQQGDLVGIPVGRMQGDYRFSFILPLRPEMLRKVPSHETPQPATSEPAVTVASNLHE